MIKKVFAVLGIILLIIILLPQLIYLPSALAGNTQFSIGFAFGSIAILIFSIWGIIRLWRVVFNRPL